MGHPACDGAPMIITPWTDQEHRHLVTLVNTGATARVIAAILGRSRSAIIGRCHRFDITLAVPEQGATRSKASYKPPTPRRDKASVIGLHRVSSAPPPPQATESPAKAPRFAKDTTTPTTTLTAATRLQCKAVIGEVTTDSAMCGAPVHAKSFCQYHHARYYKRSEQ